MTVSEVTRYTYEVDDGVFAECVLGEDFDAAQSELTALKAELASEEKDHAELRDVVAALREDLARVKGLDHNQLLAESAAQHLIKRGAENYTGEVFTIQLDDGTTKFEVVVSTQKVGAITVYERLTAAEQRNADDSRDAERYRALRKVTPYRFKKMQDASVTDGGDVLYFHSDRFDALMDVEMTKPTESGASE